MAKIRKSTGEMPLSKLACTEWDFSSVPNVELPACMVWEYLRECPGDIKLGWGTQFLCLQWSYDNWEDRKKLNTRYRNVPKNVIAAAFDRKGKGLPPWQGLDRATRESFVSTTHRRQPLIPLKLCRLTLWDWTYTFDSENAALEFGDWFKGLDDWLATLDEKTRQQMEKSSHHIPSVLTGKSTLDECPLNEGEENSKHVDASEIIAAMKPNRAGIPMDLVAAKLCGFAMQPDFLINWQEYNKSEIKKAFANWLDQVEPKKLRPHVENSEMRFSSLLKDLQGLGVMRLLHVYTLSELIAEYPAEFKELEDKSKAKDFYNMRTNAIEKYGRYIAMTKGDLPISAPTKGGKSIVGR